MTRNHTDHPSTKADLLLSRLKNVKGRGGKYTACCPAHADKTPSLSVRTDTEDGRILLHCFAGCDIADICTAIGLEVSDLYPATRPQGHAYARLSDVERRDLEDAQRVLEITKAMYENQVSAGVQLNNEDQDKYQLAVVRARKIREALRRG